MRSLDDANRPFLSIGRPAEYQDGLRQRTRNDDFVVNRIVCKTMHGSADHCFLTFEHSNRWSVLLRQPGEGRNLRMGHSVGHQYLFPLAVVCNGLSLAELQRDLVEG